MSQRSILRIGLFLFICTSLALLVSIASDSSHASGLTQVIFIDVGLGDSALIRDGNGFDVLIDGGDRGAGPTVVAVIHEQSVDDLDIILVSHSHSDHVGGLIKVLEATDIPVEAVWYNGYPGDTQTWYDFVAAVEDRGLQLTPVYFPMETPWGNLNALILNPEPGWVDPDPNQSSSVVLVQDNEVTFLFAADIDDEIEATVQAHGTPLAAEILKVPHHGSAEGSSPSFLAAVGPEVAVISVGENIKGYPSDDTIARLLAVGAQVFRTDLDGSIHILSDGVSYVIEKPSLTPTATNILVPSPTETATPVASMTDTATPTATASDTPTPTASDTPTPTPSDTPTPTASDTPTPTASDTPTPTPSDTPTPTASDTPTPTPSGTPTPTATPVLPPNAYSLFLPMVMSGGNGP